MILIDNFPYDASLSEKHTLNSEATKFPVEQGADMTDHIRQLPAEVEIESIVSDTPIGAVAQARTEGAVTLGDGDIPDAVLPSEEARTRLEEIWTTKRRVTIQTGLGARNGGKGGKIYESMAMTGLDFPLDPGTGNALKFTATFEQITIVTNLRATIRTATPGGSGVQKMGGLVKATGGTKDRNGKVDRVRETGEGMWFDPDINCWRHTTVFNNTTKTFDFLKGPLRDGFMGTDEQCRAHVRSLPDGPRNDKLMPAGFGRPGELTKNNVGPNRRIPHLGTDNLGRKVTVF